jgi:hypothetical protein
VRPKFKPKGEADETIMQVPVAGRDGVLLHRQGERASGFAGLAFR